MSEILPWNRQEIFHDEIDGYPLPDFFPLEKYLTGKSKQYSEAEDVELPDPLQADNFRNDFINT